MDESGSLAGVRRSLPLKIAAISCALLTAAILVLSILSVRSIQTSSFQTAMLMGRNKLIGDIASFQDNLALKYGQISLINGELADEQGNFIKYDYTIVDRISSLLGVHATVFMKEGDNFRRIATSIIDSSGNRAVDTFLGEDSPAYNPVSSGSDYFGNAVILGKDYLTAYRPIFAHNSNEVIGILFIGIEMSAINEYITSIKNSTIISSVINAVIILILAVLVNMAICRVILLNPIRAVMSMLKHLREGDLSKKLTIHSNDEIGEMANYINNTTEKIKSMVAELEQNGRLLDTANTAAVILLANNDAAAFENSLLRCFKLIGHCLDADRVQIWRNEVVESEPHFVLRYEWLSDYGINCKSIPVDMHFPYSLMKEWARKFINHEYINAPVCELPAEDQAFFGFYDMKSIVIIPMYLEGDFWGFFSINDCRRERTFSEEEINILTSTGLMMSSAVNRNLQTAIMRESDERVQLMFDAAPFGASFWDEGLNIIDCNSEMVRLFELKNKQEFIDRFFELSPECQPDGRNSREMAFEYLSEALNKNYGRYEWMHQKLNGEPIPCEVFFVRIKYKGKYSLTAYIRDLREQQAMIAANEKILEANERIQAIFEATPLAITMWDPVSFALIDCNMEAVRLVGLSDKKSYIEKFAEMSPEYQPNGQKTSEMVVQIFDETMREGICRYNWEQKNVDGEVIPFQVSTVRIRHMSGYIVISYAQDMREINAAIAKMRKNDEFTQVMFKAMPLACQLWNIDLQCIMCNDETVRVYRTDDRKYFLDNFFNFSPEYQPCGILSKEKGYDYLKKGFDDGYFRFEWIHKRGDGEEFPCEITMIRAMFNGEPALLTYTRDLSDEIAMLKERQKAEIAEESNKAKSNFLARMSHEIRTPMNAILGITEIQLQDETHPPVTKEAFERIYNSGSLLLGIINDILDLSKIEVGKLELTPDQYDIASLIHDAVQINIMRYETKSIEFVLDIEENLPLLFFGDELRIKQILNNLLSNAFKYTEKGSIKMSVYAEQADTADASKKNLVFIITDTGQGMTDEQVQKLGSEYSRFNLQANRKTEGTGLGMNITRNLIKLMNGVISVESAPGEGSTFTVRIPQDSASSSVIGKEIADNLMGLKIDNSVKLRTFQMKREYMPYGRVLVVDDVETNLYVAKGLMMPYGLTVETAMSGFEAIDKIRDGSVYDIIFMDHMMPRMDGIEAVKIIRSLGYSRPIVALTANAITGQAAIFMENGFDDFISKPIDIRQLNIALNKLIRDKYPADVVEAARKQKSTMFSGGVRKNSPEPQLAEIFVRDAKRVLLELETIYTNNYQGDDDLSTFVIDIHAMKTALANVGETDLSVEAAKLEQEGREKNIKLILSELPSFMETLRTVIEKLEPGEDVDKNAENAGDNQFLKEKLLIVREACTSYEKKIAKDALAKIKEKAWPRSVNERIYAISAHLLHSDFEEAIQIIDSYIWQI
jgi:signal transduction histidine kinase/CheY-like chemotaxis protein/HPt (histidine-containing phosphotransfer) domain-containing protein/HAMP domain-containing protein